MSRAAVGPGARGWLAIALFGFVAVVAMQAMEPTPAGVYYDDGVYLALSQSLARGSGYTYANLPGELPGVKYPPGYPAVLAIASSGLPEYPGNLGALKALNTLFLGLAAAFGFLLFTRPDPESDAPVRLLVFGTVAALAFTSAQMMSVTTVLLSEPLFLAGALGTLLLAGRARFHPTLLGLAAAAVFLTRSLGISLVVAVAAGIVIRREVPAGSRLRSSALFALGALGPSVAWISWARLRAGDVPAPLAGFYGGYLGWWGDGSGSPIDVARGNWAPFVGALEHVWIPDASAGTATLVLIVLGGLALAGARAAFRSNPSLAVFPLTYLFLVAVWPYEPDRYLYPIVPLLTLLVVEGGFAATRSIQRELPKIGLPAVSVIAALLLFNSAAFQWEAHRGRVWAPFQIAPAATYAPLLEWIRENTNADEVVASGLDPLVFWETGRKAVPGFQSRASDFRRTDWPEDELVRDFEELREATGFRWVAVVLGEGKAGLTMDAFAARHPERTRAAHEAVTGPYTAVVYEVLPEGEIFADSLTTPPSPR